MTSLTKATLRFVLLPVVFIAILVFSGCKKGQGYEDLEKSSLNRSDRVVIKFYSSFDNARWEKLKAEIEKYEYENEHVAIEVENSYWSEYWGKLKTLTASDNMPDVWTYTMAHGEEWLDSGWIMSLNQFIENDPDMDIEDFNEYMISNFTKDGEIFALPYDFGAPLLYYNKSIFDEAGLDYPDESWTFNDLIKAGKIIMEKVKRPDGKVYGLAANYNTDWQIIGLIDAFGGGYVSEDGKVLVYNPGTIEALKLMKEFSKITPPIEEQNVRPHPSWKEGRAAMIFGGPWFYELFRNPKGGQHGFTLMPKGSVGRPQNIIGSGFCVSFNSKYPSHGYELIKHITSKEVLEKAGLGIPARKSAIDSLTGDWKELALLNQKYSKKLIAKAGMRETFEEQKKEIEKMLLFDNTTPEQVAKKIEELLKKYVENK